MGNAKFFYYPQPDGRHLVEIEVSSPTAKRAIADRLSHVTELDRFTHQEKQRFVEVQTVTQ